MEMLLNNPTAVALLTILLSYTAIRVYIHRRISSATEIEEQPVDKKVSTFRYWLDMSLIVALVLLFSSTFDVILIGVAALTLAAIYLLIQFIESFNASLIIAKAKLFEKGDWINLSGSLGEVDDIGKLFTSLRRINLDSANIVVTNDVMVIPNRLFIQNGFSKDHDKKYVCRHQFSLVQANTDIDTDSVIEFLEAGILRHRDVASLPEDIASRITSKPNIYVRTNPQGLPVYAVEFSCPTVEMATIESAVTQDFLKFQSGKSDITQAPSKKIRKDSKTLA